MANCPHCNNPLENNARFCNSCGAPVAPAQQPAPNANMQYNPQYAQPNVQQNTMPVARLKTDRSFLKTFLLSLITFGIYGLVVYAHITDDVNLVCTRYDNKKSMNYWLLILVVTPLTFGIASIVWMHRICNRIGGELQRRQVPYDFSAKTFWLWNVLGSLILVGPFVFAHKFFKAVNMMNDSFNRIG